MLDDEKMTHAAQHFAKWLRTGDDLERAIGLDLFREAVSGESVEEITKRLPGFVDVVNAHIGYTSPDTPERSTH
jgi:hypothetical protein